MNAMRSAIRSMGWRRAVAALAAAIGVVATLQAAWIEVKAFAAQALIEAAWQRNQLGALSARPWPWADTTPIARLTVLARDPRSVSMPAPYAIPRGESLIVLEGSSGRNLAFGPTHDAASVLPGDAGNSVIAAHRDTHFKILERLAPGDRLRIERIDGRVAFFAVTDIRIVDSRQARIALDADAPRVTLVTCYPFDAIRPGGPLRFVVTADLIAGAGLSPPRSGAYAAASMSIGKKSPAALFSRRYTGSGGKKRGFCRLVGRVAAPGPALF
jgi:sortase A